MLQPSLFCRTFLNASNQQKVGGFRVPLSGSDQSALVRQLSQQLRSYQQQGGSLSRCMYSGYLSPSLVSSRLNGQPPSALVRKADSYRIPVYSTYQQFLAANNQRASRFGVIVSQPSRRTQSGAQKIMRISVNNALVLFVDARNQQAFRLEPAGVSLRLMPLSKEVQQVLADAAKPSLQRLVDFKRLKKLAPRTSPSPSPSPSSPSPSSSPSSSSFYDASFAKLSASLGGTAAQVAALPDSLTGVISPREVFFASGAKQDAVADEFVSLFAAALASSAEITQVVPSAYCRVQSSFYPQAFCAQLETGAVQDLVQCESAFTGRDRELMLCRLLFDEVAKIQGVSGSRGETVAPSIDPDADAGVSDQNPDGAISDGGLEGPGDEIADSGDASLGGEGSLEGDFGDPGMAGDAGLAAGAGLDEYDDPDQMLPDGMSPPVAAGCNATNFGEQFLCLFLQALSGMMQEAFAK